MKKSLFLLIGLLALILLLASCDIPTKPMQAVYHSPVDFLGDQYVPVANCDFGSPVKPTNLAPGGEGVVTEPSPDLTWDFSGCEVYSFTINMSASPTFSLANILHEDVLEDERSLAIDYDYLADCSTYYWYIRAWGSTEYTSDVASFRTDFSGECPAVETCSDAPSTPSAISPASLYTEVRNPQIWWVDSNPDCVAENYHYEVATDPAFTDLVLEGDTSLHSVSPDEFLEEDCSNYFWRVTAEANGYERTSNVVQFGTQFTGMCGHTICNASDLVAPELVYPADGAVVTDMTPQFVWNYDLETCWPDHFVIEVTSTPDFTNNLWHSVYRPQLTWQTAYDGNFSNCTKYYWRVSSRTMPATTIVNSDIFFFTTNFGNTICGLEWLHEIPVEMVRDWGLGCVSANQMWAIYEFKGPIIGDFEVRVGGKTWPCKLMEGTNNRLMCFGPLAPQQVESEVRLFLVGGEEPVLTQQGLTPQCVGTIVCQPPAEGCSPKNIGTVKPIYVPTHWDASQCACVP